MYAVKNEKRREEDETSRKIHNLRFKCDFLIFLFTNIILNTIILSEILIIISVNLLTKMSTPNILISQN